MKSALIVSYHFPPSMAARALQIGKLLKYAERLGFKFTVVCADSIQGGGVAQDGWWKCPSGVSVTVCHAITNLFIDKVSSLITVLPHRSWCDAAITTATNLIIDKGASRYSCIITFGMPMDTHLCGLKLKKRFPKLPWLAHFSDPWLGSPYIESRGPWQSILQSHIENQVATEADRLVFVSKELLNHFSNNHPKFTSKYDILEHVFDSELYGMKEDTKRKIYCLTYVGGFNALRDYQPLLDLLRALIENVDNLSDFKIVFVGGQTQKATEALNSIIPGIAHSHGAVSYTESLRLMQQADCLLVVDANFKNSPFFPSKLVDYFGSKRPIIGISPSNSCTTNVLSRFGMPVFNYKQIGACAGLIAEILSGSRHLPEIPKEAVESHEATHVASKFISMIAQLTNQSL